MRIITGDNTGLTKVVEVESSKVLSQFNQQDRDNEQDFLAFFGNENLILSGNRKGVLQLNEINDEGVYERLITVVDNNKSLIGLNTINTDKIVLTYDNNSTEIANYDQESEEFQEFQEIYNASQSQMQRAILNQEDKKSLLVLAKDINPQIYDLETKKQIWKARNVKNDWLDLKVPIYDVDGAFFRDNSQNIYTINAYKKMRIYDLRQNNSQPTKDIQQEFDFDKSAFRKMQLTNCGNYIFVSTVNGNLFKFDVRKDFRMIFNFKGSIGSVKDIKIHPTLPYIASVSLDRYLRVYHQETKQLINKINLKQRLHSLLFSNQGLLDESESEQEEQQEEDEEIVENKKRKIPSLNEDSEEEAEQTNLTKKNQKLQQKDKLKNYEKRSISSISQTQTYQKIVEHKKKFQNLKKHSIKLKYLEGKFEQDKEALLQKIELDKQKQEQKQQKQKIVQEKEVEEAYNTSKKVKKIKN
ncbi:hypothetical protein ABPG72_013571 [Tetrahymena utriculariae]